MVSPVFQKVLVASWKVMQTDIVTYIPLHSGTKFQFLLNGREARRKWAAAPPQVRCCSCKVTSAFFLKSLLMY